MFAASLLLAAPFHRAVANQANANPVYVVEDAEGSPDLSVEEHAWERYHSTVIQQLRESANPRDWVLAAANTPDLRDDSEFGPTAEMLMRNAVAAAPDDPFVQWWAATASFDHRGTCAAPTTSLKGDAVAALARLEPDNAAVWQLALDLAVARKDEPGIDDALSRMALAARFDTHFLQSIRATLAAYERTPMDTALVEYARKIGPVSENSLRFTHALAVTAAIALPAFQNLTRACGDTPANDWSRLSHCEDIGRLMVAKGDTIIAQRIGLVVLRKIGRLTEADREMQRRGDWLLEQTRRRQARSVDDQEVADWKFLDSEMEIQRRALTRAGLSPEPPSDWVSPVQSWSTPPVSGASKRKPID